MRVQLWLTPQGQAEVAAGRPATSWGVSVTEVDLDMTTQGYLSIKTLVILDSELPDRKACIQATLSRLAEQEHKLREKLNEDLARIEQMRNEVLALEMS